MNIERFKIFMLGFRKTLPYQSGVIPFGVLYATLAQSAGFAWWQILLFSLFVLGGSSQLVFIDLVQHMASPLQAVLGSNIVNARHLIYSADVSSKYSSFSLRWRLILSYLLTDQLYAVTQSSNEQLEKINPTLLPWYYFGSGFSCWFFWMISSGLGIIFGHFIPASWNLGFSIPLMFMPLVFTVCKNNFAYVVCLFSIIFTYFFQSLPMGIGVVFAILLSSTLGFFLQKYFSEVRP